MALQPSRETVDVGATRRINIPYWLGIALVLLGSGAAFGALYLLWGHWCPPPGPAPAGDCSTWGPADTQPFTPFQDLSSAYAQILLPIPILGVLTALFLIVARGRWRYVARAVGILVGVFGLCSASAAAGYSLSLNDSVAHRVWDEGAYLALVGYVALLAGTLLAAIGPREQS